MRTWMCWMVAAGVAVSCVDDGARRGPATPERLRPTALDRDGDGIPNSADKCPDKPEDLDDFEDQDGCPDHDNDKDGISDGDDRCPNTPENFNGHEDQDGCPDRAAVMVTKSKIVMKLPEDIGVNESPPGVWRRTAKGTVLSKVSVGGGKHLVLKRLRVTVQVEGMRVRTVLDHIYFNPYARTLQGTFKYTLPADASISYYAMYVGQARRQPRFFSPRAPGPRVLVRRRPEQLRRLAAKGDWGQLREGRIVPAERGREVYEEITRRRIDPALVEQVAPNTFRGRVFPVPAKGYNRVIIAYEETLPRFKGQHVYRFRFPRDKAERIDFSFAYNGRLARLRRHNLRALGCRSKMRAGFGRCVWKNRALRRDAVLYFQPRRSDAAWVAGTDPTSKKRYLYTQLRVKLPRRAVKKGAEQAVFLLDTSLSENPDHFAANVALLQKLLAKNPHLKRFNVLFFDVGALWARPQGWISNTPGERSKLFRRIKALLLEGATSLAAAMDALATPPWLKGKGLAADVFLLSDGQVNWGEREVERIVARFKKRSRWGNVRFFSYQLGIGAENLALHRRLAREGGALFTCLGRADLDRCAVAHTGRAMLLQRVSIAGIGVSEVLVAGRQASLFPGGLVTVAARYLRDGRAKLVLHGVFDGKPIKLSYGLDVRARGDLAPRAWAQLAVDQLLALGDPRLVKLIVAYGQHFRIPNRHCSFLVLETDKEYKLYKLEPTRKAQRVGDLARFIDKRLAIKGRLVSERERFQALLGRGAGRAGKRAGPLKRTLKTLLGAVPARAFRLTGKAPVRLWTRAMVPAAYLRARKKSPGQFATYLGEARRRLRLKRPGGALRSLSTIVERHPADPRALRLTGYYLLAWQQPVSAAWAFRQVLERRSFEPHAFRDLARALIKAGRPGLAAALYEVVIAGKWHDRFGSVNRIAREEYALLLQRALKSRRLSTALRRVLKRRQALLASRVERSTLRVTVTWNTDHTDIDLWVLEPGGQKCWYKEKKTRNGGVLLEDITRGYGPERYAIPRGPRGTYKIQLKFFGHSSNTFGNETHAAVVIVLHAGTPRQRVIRKSLVLRKKNHIVTVATLKL